MLVITPDISFGVCWARLNLSRSFLLCSISCVSDITASIALCRVLHLDR